MSENNNQVTQEQIRQVRQAGFDGSISHRPDAERQRLTNAHRTQDANRERNITEFYGSVLGSN